MNFLDSHEPHIKNLYCTGINYKTSDIDVRESVSLTEEIREELYHFFKSENLFQEALILSTCNRLEIYGTLTPGKDKEEASYRVWWHILESTDHCQTSFQNQVLPKTYTFTGKEALQHIFKVACSLDSLCLGETQITGQFKKAYQESRKSGMSRLVFGRLNREALTLNRKIRNRTSLGKRGKSMSHLAIDLALHIFQTLEHKNFTLIGAGKMIALAYDYALEHKPDSITIVNRTEERAIQLVRPGTNTSTKSFEELSEALLTSDIIVSSTASKSFILEKETLRKVQALRKNKPLFIIDIALPRDIDPSCSDIDSVYLFDLDDIRKVVSLQNNHYEEDLAIAHELLEERVEIFESWVGKIESSKALNNFGSYLNELFLREEARTLKKKDFEGLSKTQKASIHTMLQSISQKILSDTALSMKQTESPNSELIEIKLKRKFLEKRGRLH